MKKILAILVVMAAPFTVHAETGISAGVILPLSGVLAEYGIAAKNGIEMARAENPELFEGVRLLYEDSQWDAKSAVSSFNKLRETKGVALIFNWGNPTTEAIAPLSERYKFPVIAMTLDPRVVAHRHYLIRSTNPASDFSAVLAADLREKGFRYIGVVLAENTYVQGLLNGLRLQLDGQKIEEIATHTISESDFRSTVARIKTGNYDALGVFLISGQVSSFYRQLRSQGVTLPSFGTDFFESSTEIKQSEGGMEGATYTHLAVSPEFEAAYVARYGNDYQLAYAGNAHDMALLIATLFGKSKEPLSGEAVMSALRAAPEIRGVTGAFRYRSTSEGDAYFDFPIALKKIEGGKITVLKRSR